MIALSTLSCDAGLTYVQFVKKTGTRFGEESFQVLSGTEIVFTSPPFAKNDEKTMEACLPVNSRSVYVLEMVDSGNNSWDDGAWIAIYGVNGNCVYRNFMSELGNERSLFSLYAPVNKNEQWKFSSLWEATWTAVDHDDSEWTTLTLGSTTSEATGTQYFRKSFIGVTGMAAIELQLQYAHGVVAYVNGVEVFRDNMPQGPIASSTPASGSYATSAYRGTIRSSLVAETANSVIAAELHYSESDSRNPIDFNGFLTFASGVSEDVDCFVVPTQPTITAGSFRNINKAFDGSRRVAATVSQLSLPQTISMRFPSEMRPQVNAIRMWPYSDAGSAPSSFQLVAMRDTSSSVLIRAFDSVFADLQWKRWDAVATTPFRELHLVVEEGRSDTVKLYELQLLVCRSTSVPIMYPQSAYVFYTRYSRINLRSNAIDVQNCSVTPSLPEGIAIDPETCDISGTTQVVSPQTLYQVTAQRGGETLTGEVTLSFLGCAGSMIRILRTYQFNPEKEGFHIRDTVTDAMLLEVPIGHTSPASSDAVYYLCVTTERYDVTLEGSSTYWKPDSYLWIFGMLPENEEELLLKVRYDSVQNNDVTYFMWRHTIGSGESWLYKMGAIPSGWYGSDTEGWGEGVRGSFPDSSNQIQLYKKTFELASLEHVSGLILSLRYKYGCVVYLNGYEAWRNGVDGELGLSSLASNSYMEVLYRVVTLPGRRLVEGNGVGVGGVGAGGVGVGDVGGVDVGVGGVGGVGVGDVDVDVNSANGDHNDNDINNNAHTNPNTPTQHANLLKEGQNTIAIALISENAATQRSSFFDATLRLMTDQPESHIWEFTAEMSGIVGSEANPFDQYHSTYLKYTWCSPNWYVLRLEKDRREWINSVQIQNYYLENVEAVRQFRMYARNREDDPWVPLKNVTGLVYSMAAQRRRVYIANDQPYNQFRFEDFSTGNPKECKWRLQSLNLVAENVMNELSPLVYPPTITVYKNVEMAEVIPQGDGYGDYSISPALPEGLMMDTTSGWISGTATELSPAREYTVTAMMITGGSTTVTLGLSVELCTGGKSLITVRIRADGSPQENSWKLFEGRTTEGTPLQSVSEFPVKNNYYYLDFCLADGLYTFQAIDSFGDGWSSRAGYTLTADLGTLELEIMQIPEMETRPAAVSTTFSSFFPFQMEYSEWKVEQSLQGVPSDWTQVEFDDSAWRSTLASQINGTEAITTYIRKAFVLPNTEDYQVLNIHIRYAGGVVAYYNGQRVGRFNLEKEFTAMTESITVHDVTLLSRFHVILPTAGSRQGANVVAFEVHRPVGASSSESIVFDATGVFGVDTCSTVVDSYAVVTSTPLKSGSLNGIMDLDPYTTGTLPMDVGTYLEWKVENLESSKWNTFNILGGSTVRNWGFVLTGTLDSENATEPLTLYHASNLTLVSNEKKMVEVPVAVAGIHGVRWEVTDSGDRVPALSSVHMGYCKALGAVCPGVDAYPAVGEGQISASVCPEGFIGYSYRICLDGVLSDIQMDHCTYKVPEDVHYASSRLVFVEDTRVSSGTPLFKNVVTRWSTNAALPRGLVLNEETGEISGIPTETTELLSFTIYAENPSGAATVVVTLQVRKGVCPADGVFPVTVVGEEAVYECSRQSQSIGTQRRYCMLGSRDGEWGLVKGSCIPMALVVVGVLIALGVVLVVIYLLLRIRRRKWCVCLHNDDSFPKHEGSFWGNGFVSEDSERYHFVKRMSKGGGSRYDISTPDN